MRDTWKSILATSFLLGLFNAMYFAVGFFFIGGVVQAFSVWTPVKGYECQVDIEMLALLFTGFVAVGLVYAICRTAVVFFLKLIGPLFTRTRASNDACGVAVNPSCSRVLQEEDNGGNPPRSAYKPLVGWPTLLKGVCGAVLCLLALGAARPQHPFENDLWVPEILKSIVKIEKECRDRNDPYLTIEELNNSEHPYFDDSVLDCTRSGYHFVLLLGSDSQKFAVIALPAKLRIKTGIISSAPARSFYMDETEVPRWDAPPRMPCKESPPFERPI